MPPPSFATSDADDLALLHQIATGNRSALAEMYRAYHPRLGRFLWRMTRRPELIEEVINDCFWVVWKRAAEFRGDSRPSSWIMGIAYRCTLKTLRQEVRLDSMEDLGADLDEPSADPHPQREMQDWLAKGFQYLNTEQIATLELAYGSGHSLEEIAAIMQCPVSTVKARMFHARVKLRNLLPALAQPHQINTTPGAGS